MLFRTFYSQHPLNVDHLHLITETMHTLTVYALGLALIAFTGYSFLNAVTKYNEKYNPRGLPGPTLVPWLGRVHDLPIQFMWLKFKEWADIYGPIYRTKMLGANFVIISDESIAEDILIKRAKIYSDRPEIKSLFDAKSTYGSMEYLPLMGKNRMFIIAYLYLALMANFWKNTGLVSENSLTLT